MSKKPGKSDHGQKPPTPANPTRQRHQLGLPTGKKKQK
jgi:hypothetical protein